MLPQGQEIKGPGQGYLVIKKSWPWGARTISGDHERFQNVYFSNFKGYYMTGDGARVDDDGYYWLIGGRKFPTMLTLLQAAFLSQGTNGYMRQILKAHAALERRLLAAEYIAVHSYVANKSVID